METAAVTDWGRALVLLVIVSALFLTLRILGRTFLALDFEILVIHVPTAVSLLIYAAEKRYHFLSRSAASIPKA